MEAEIRNFIIALTKAQKAIRKVAAQEEDTSKADLLLTISEDLGAFYSCWEEKHGETLKEYLEKERKQTE